jgi:hypothetical protein
MIKRTPSLENSQAINVVLSLQVFFIPAKAFFLIAPLFFVIANEARQSIINYTNLNKDLQIILSILFDLSRFGLL